MKYVLVNYNFDPSWVKDYTDDYLIYDRSDDGQDWCKDVDKSKVIYTENLGNVDYDRLDYLVEHYDNLPDVFLLAKSNLFKSISKEEFELVKHNTTFTPLLTKHHKTYSDRLGPVCFYRADMYWERNDSWYLQAVPAKTLTSFNEWAQLFHLPTGMFIPFAPGGNYILTRDTVRKYSKDLYQEMRDMLPYCTTPGEAQCVERSYYLLWK